MTHQPDWWHAEHPVVAWWMQVGRCAVWLDMAGHYCGCLPCKRVTVLWGCCRVLSADVVKFCRYFRLLMGFYRSVECAGVQSVPRALVITILDRFVQEEKRLLIHWCEVDTTP